MKKESKIMCDRGSYLGEKIAKFDNFETEAMVCPKCGFLTLTREQAEKYVRMKQLHQIIDAERKIIKIGNSMGLTLPDKLRDFGIRIGKKVKTEALS